jgi:hypothetical protein
MVREPLMLILVSALLLAVGLGLLATTGLLLILKVWLLFIMRLCEGHYIRASLWLFVALELTTFLVGLLT